MMDVLRRRSAIIAGKMTGRDLVNDRMAILITLLAVNDMCLLAKDVISIFSVTNPELQCSDRRVNHLLCIYF